MWEEKLLSQKLQVGSVSAHSLGNLSRSGSRVHLVNLELLGSKALNCTWLQVFFFFVFDQRARIAFWAIARRSSGVSFSCRALAPKRPNATAFGFFSFFSDIWAGSNLASLLPKNQISY